MRILKILKENTHLLFSFFLYIASVASITFFIIEEKFEFENIYILKVVLIIILLPLSFPMLYKLGSTFIYASKKGHPRKDIGKTILNVVLLKNTKQTNSLCFKIFYFSAYAFAVILAILHFILIIKI